MLITKEINANSLKDELWSGALDTLDYLTLEETETVLDILDTGDPMNLTELNDFFWFNDDTIAEWLGYEDFDELMSREEREA